MNGGRLGSPSHPFLPLRTHLLRLQLLETLLHGGEVLRGVTNGVWALLDRLVEVGLWRKAQILPDLLDLLLERLQAASALLFPCIGLA